MTEITRDDIRAAVAAGMISEAQAASIVTLSDDRRGARAHLSGLDEPFELFRGFNEIFIVVGLVILYAGYTGLTGIGLITSDAGYIGTIVFGFVGAVAVALLARYFTVTRRMVAPSIALVIMFALSIWQIGLGIGWTFDATAPQFFTVAAALTTLALVGYYLCFRVPFAMALIALGVFMTTFGIVTLDGTLPDDPRDFFLLSAGGPFAIITVILGLIGFAVAMWFDMGDPHRVSLRSRAGFWLHVIAAPAIVNTVALTLFETGSLTAQAIIVLFVALLAVVAVVIDRRSFLVSGVGYIVAVVFTVLEGNGFLAILALGLGLVLLGAKWEVLRRWLMDLLPDFPGKRRLPPWALTTETS
ncbi:hypothetical protein HKCCE2091_17035 [Rhodobacterales bacterium HKCCE2091]|nr:hypothetical protein [Rhodobacterales bacterium HKCCE2091]